MKKDTVIPEIAISVIFTLDIKKSKNGEIILFLPGGGKRNIINDYNNLHHLAHMI